MLVILRGGMDGLGAAPAVGDPDFAAARGPLAQYGAPTLPLDATIALHPNLAELHAMYGRGEAAVVHAIGLAYRERSLKFHMGEWSPQEAVDFLVARVGHERDNAKAEVRRSFQGGYGPLYQAAYLLGGLELRGLRRELVDSKQMTEKAFHDELLRQGGCPSPCYDSRSRSSA